MNENEERIKFLADESCDFIVVRALRSSGYDVLSVAESYPSVSDLEVLKMAVDEKRVLLTEDKDFGEWVFAHKKETHGGVFLRYTANLRRRLGDAVKTLVAEHSLDLVNCFTVLEPGRARIRKL